MGAKRVVMLTLTLLASAASLILIIAAVEQNTWVTKETKLTTQRGGLEQLCDSVLEAMVYCTDKDTACLLSEKGDRCRYLKGGEAARGMVAIEGLCVVLGPIVYMLVATYKGSVPSKLAKNMLFCLALGIAIALHIATFATWGAMAKNFIEANEFSLGGGFYTYLVAFFIVVLNLVASIFI